MKKTREKNKHKKRQTASVKKEKVGGGSSVLSAEKDGSRDMGKIGGKRGRGSISNHLVRRCADSGGIAKKRKKSHWARAYSGLSKGSSGGSSQANTRPAVKSNAKKAI